MCKSIKKSCFVIALSFMSFAFYSVDVNSNILARRAAPPSNSALDEQAKNERIIADIYAQDPKAGDSLYEELPIGPYQQFLNFKAKPHVKYTVKFKRLNGQPYGAAETVMPRSSNLDVVLPMATPAEAPAALEKQ